MGKKRKSDGTGQGFRKSIFVGEGEHSEMKRKASKAMVEKKSHIVGEVIEVGEESNIERVFHSPEKIGDDDEGTGEDTHSECVPETTGSKIDGKNIESSPVPSAVEVAPKSLAEQLDTRSAVLAAEARNNARKERARQINEAWDEVISTPPPSITVAEAVQSWHLEAGLADVLIADGVTTFFPIQRVIIPLLLDMPNTSGVDCFFRRDICASAPTGSGKTLAYALPIVQNLMRRIVTRVRALVILPSRELAVQVFSVFCRIAHETDLGIALLSGNNSFESEQETLVGKKEAHTLSSSRNRVLQTYTHIHGRSKADIVVCTPGRLLEHLEQTKGFTLQHLRYGKIDIFTVNYLITVIECLL